jgi:hypothetical protein
MPATKKPAKGPQDKISYAILNKLVATLGPQQLTTFLNRNFTAKRTTMRNASTVRMQCPLNRHPDTEPSFDFDTSRSTIHCFGCGYHTKNFFQFLQDSLGWSYPESAKVLQDQTGMRVFNEKNSARLEALDTHRLAVAAIMRACNRYAQDAVVYWKTGVSPEENTYENNALISTIPTLQWLFEERKHDPDALPYMPYGILPPLATLRQLVSAQINAKSEENLAANRPVIGEDKHKKVLARAMELTANLDTMMVYSVTFHYGYAMNIPGRIRLRRPTKDGGKNIIALEGFEETDPIGFFGMYDPYNPFTGEDLKRMVPLLVEGENDALSIAERLWKQGKNTQLVFAIGGNNNDMDQLYEAGFERVKFWSDGDQGGVDLIKSRVTTAFELDVRVFNRWDLFRQVGVKDPDDAVQVHGIEKIIKEVIEDANGNFVTLDVWAFQQAMAAYADIEDPTDVREKTRVAAEYGRLVRHPALQQQYIKEIAKAFDIHAGTVQQEILKRTDTEESFVLRIAETLRRDYHLVFKEEDSRNSYIVMFHKEKRRLIRLAMMDGESCAVQLSNIHGPINDYFRNVIGLPSFLATAEGLEDNTNLQPIKQHYKDMCNYLKVSLQHLYVGLLDRRLCKELGQGVHYVADPHDPDRRVTYIVNGNAVYKGEYDDNAAVIEVAPPVRWTALPGPSDGHYVFNVGFEAPVDPWSKEIVSIADLEESNTLDIVPFLRRTIEMFSTHWSFKHQKLDAAFLAYHLFATSVAAAFPTMVMVAFLGDTHSGKTTCLNVFSGISSRKMQLLEACGYVSNFTQASIYQGWDNSTRALAIDEFEDDGGLSHKSRQVEDVLAMLRQIVNEEGITVERGGKDGVMTTRHLRMPIFTAAIRQPRQAADLNRRHEIEMNKIKGHADANVSILSAMTPEELRQVRRAVTLGLLRWIPRLKTLSEQVEKELLAKQVVPHNVNNRTLKNFTPAATVAALVGDDWRAFVRESCIARKQKHDAIASETTSQTIYDRVLFTASISTGQNRSVRIPLSEMLATEEAWPQINTSGVGFFFIPELKIGIIHWITAQTALLHPWNEYASTPHRTLKDAFDRHPNAVKTEDFDRLGIWPHVQRLIPASRKPDVSVVDLKAFIEDARNRGSGSAPSAPSEPPQAASPPAESAPQPSEAKTDANDNLP